MLSLFSLLVSLGLVGAAASSGARFRPDGWYRQLAKPAWTPPDLAFPIVWGILYLLMALAANAAWSWLFFGRRQILLGLLDIALLLCLIAACIALFAPSSALAAWLMVPYLLWVTLALALNASVWRRNRRA